ncbi:hypothetical protein HPB47_022936 [Ixodes persulcatus]|uniref:Uncharacterized protein n=1 Tax=Ixodes persulcatus TaxID=34615 RepID=A0AC60Q8X0_IXOPE|nr:hypothetical protein HPB47_022936 [Ixodes persulcatus]
MPFVRTEDDRLSWLEVDFISYLEDIKLESTKSWVKSLTKETYEATIMTTRSTVAVIEYLLTDLKFKYVLTRPLNSDPVESLFSCFRQFNGVNDRVDARTAVFTAEKLLKVGILEAARSGNAPSSSESQTALKCASSTRETGNPAVPEAALGVLWKIQHLMKYNEVPSELEFAPLTYMAGYLAFVCEQKVTCPECKLQLKGNASRDGAYQFVFSLDQGGLSYPRPEAVWLCKLVCTFVERALQSAEIRRCGRICKVLSSAVLPHLMDCPLMWCTNCRDPYHSEELCELFLRKLLRPLLANWAAPRLVLRGKVELSLSPADEDALNVVRAGGPDHLAVFPRSCWDITKKSDDHKHP